MATTYQSTTGLKSSLGDLAGVEGIRSAAIVSMDGFVIESVASRNDVDTEAVGAVVSTALGSTQVMGGELRVGKLTQLMVEYDDGVVVVTSLGNRAALAVVASMGANLGNVRFQVKKRVAELERML